MALNAGGRHAPTRGALNWAGTARSTCAALVFVAGAASATEAEVGIQGMRFDPPTLRVKAGTAVVWVNREKRTNHSVRFEQENDLESDRLFPGETWRRTFERPGAYPYRCGPHPEMRGLIEVTE
jgi:plastocyanin